MCEEPVLHLPGAARHAALLYAQESLQQAARAARAEAAWERRAAKRLDGLALASLTLSVD